MELTNKSKPTLTIRRSHEFAIEWQRVTGQILLTNKRTRSIGTEKLRDADVRQEVLDTLINQGLL